ncbi:MAG TPA: hypothetical protein VNA89_06005 [Gemmatimonadaceae bacterium]|nr:hypothetical protein [Gemmatimonadaceae bacterium]
MKKFLFAFVVGIAIGYFYGFVDAKRHKKNVVERVVGRVGGSARAGVGNDIDGRMSAADR